MDGHGNPMNASGCPPVPSVIAGPWPQRLVPREDLMVRDVQNRTCGEIQPRYVDDPDRMTELLQKQQVTFEQQRQAQDEWQRENNGRDSYTLS
jgi:hypothetical protein